ncbi:MAG: YegS/Rv2252/BmrU family lipid kinase [Elainellaceae cyanobacterium]
MYSDLKKIPRAELQLTSSLYTSDSTMPLSIAFITFASRPDDLKALVRRHQMTLSRYHLVVAQPNERSPLNLADLDLECVASDLDGDSEIRERVVNGDMVAVILLVDLSEPHANESEIRALIETCDIHNVPLATNMATADIVIRSLSKQRIAHLIFNPVAGQGNPDQDLKLIRSVLEPQVQLNMIFTQPDVPVPDQVSDAIANIRAKEHDPNEHEASADLIIASGGDGTVSAVAGELIGTGIPLGVIPRGTANAFASAVGIPTNLRNACETILAGNTYVMDAARCNDTPMILLAGVGFEAEMVANADTDMKQFWGPLAYVLAGVRQLNQQELFSAQIEIEGEVSDIETVAITVANAAPRTSVLAQGFGEVIPNDGLLDITIGTMQTGFQAINALASLFKSTLVDTPSEQDDIVCLRSQRIKIITDPPRKIVVDGEMVGTTPAEFECIPGGLTVFTPLTSI